MFIKRGSLIKILIVLIATGLLLVPVVFAGMPYQNFGKVFTSPTGKAFATRLNFESLRNSIINKPDNQQTNNNLTYNENSTVCGSCTTDRFFNIIPYRSGKTLL